MRRLTNGKLLGAIWMQCKDILFSIVKLDPLIDPYWTFGDVYPAYVAYGKVMFSVLLTGGGGGFHGPPSPCPETDSNLFTWGPPLGPVGKRSVGLPLNRYEYFVLKNYAQLPGKKDLHFLLTSSCGLAPSDSNAFIWTFRMNWKASGVSQGRPLSITEITFTV